MIASSRLEERALSLAGLATTLVTSAALVACSASPTTTTGFGNDQGTNQATSGNDGTPSPSSGAASGGGSSSSSSGASPHVPSGSGSTGGSGSSAANSGNPMSSSHPPGDAGTSSGANTIDSGTRIGSVAGCGQATSCTPGNDLAAPPAAAGVQLATPTGGITVQPGQEAFLCYYRTLPNTAEVDIGTFQSWMTPGSSHHFIAYQIGGTGLGAGTKQPDGTLVSCPFGGGTWIFATSLPGTIVELKMPDGVGLPMAPGTQVMLNMHFINPGTTVVSPQVKMNMLYAQSIQYKAASMTSFNTMINVPAAGATGPGTQTVQGTCSAPAGSNFFIVTTHTHKHATLAEVNYVSGGQSQNLVHTTDWEHPDVRMWTAPSFLTLKPGDSFTYSCTYANSGSSPVLVGDTAASNEMCMAISYYFPAASTACQ